jgi:hypothetical protein
MCQALHALSFCCQRACVHRTIIKGGNSKPFIYLSVRPALKPRFNPLTNPVDVLSTVTVGRANKSASMSPPDFCGKTVSLPPRDVVVVPRDSNTGQEDPAGGGCCCREVFDGRAATARWKAGAAADGGDETTPGRKMNRSYAMTRQSVLRIDRRFHHSIASAAVHLQVD